MHGQRKYFSLGSEATRLAVLPLPHSLYQLSYVASISEGLPGGPCSLVPPKNFLAFPCSLKAFFRFCCSLLPKCSFCFRLPSFIFLLFSINFKAMFTCSLKSLGDPHIRFRRIFRDSAPFYSTTLVPELCR